MKKFISILLIIALVISITVVVVTAQNQTISRTAYGYINETTDNSYAAKPTSVQPFTFTPEIPTDEQGDVDYSNYCLFGSIGNYDEFNKPTPYVFSKDGKLTTTLSADYDDDSSFVALKTLNGSEFYMFREPIIPGKTNSGVLYPYIAYDFAEYDFADDWMYVPANVELTFALVYNYDETFTLSYSFVNDTTELHTTETGIVEPSDISTEAETIVPTVETYVETQTEPTEEPSTKAIIRDGYYLMGTLNGQDCWDISSITLDRELWQMHDIYFIKYQLHEGDEIKIAEVQDGSIINWYKQGTDNAYKVRSSDIKTGLYIYFTPRGRSDWQYKYFNIFYANPSENFDWEIERCIYPSTEASVAYDAEDGYYIVGKLKGQNRWGVWGSDLNERKLIQNPNNEEEYLLNYKFSLNDEMKIAKVNSHRITAWYTINRESLRINESLIGYCTVRFRPYGNSEWSHYFYTVEKADEPTTETLPTPKPHLIVDGKDFEVEQGKIYTYSYYLNVPEKVGAFDVTTYYDTNGVEWTPMAGSDGSINEEAMFPIASTASLTTNFATKGQLYYNGISVNGLSFDTDNKKLITTNFKVTASEGTYKINTVIDTLIDLNKHKYVYNGVTLDSNFTFKGDLSPANVRGDVDLDEYINIFDAYLIQRYLAHFNDSISKESLICADVDGNGEVTIIDSTLIQRYLAKLSTSPLIGKPALF